PSDGRRSPAVITRKKTEMIGVCVGHYASNRRSAHKIVNIKRIRPRFFIGSAITKAIQTIEHVRGHIETVRPNPHLWIIREPRMGRVVGPESVPPPSSVHRV